MTFLNPILAAVGLACVALPILIHILMRRRRRPVPWGAMKFLLEAYRRQRRRTRLEQLLLLASRCLLVALLALALGRPLLSRAAAGVLRGPRTLYLVVDTSLTASARAGDADPALARLRDRAAALLDGLDPARGDRAALITLASPAEGLVASPTPDLAAVADLLKSLTPTDARTDFAGAAGLLRDELRRARESGDSSSPVVALLSEFRAGSVDLATPLPTLDEPRLALLAAPPAPTPLANASIHSLEPARSVFTAPAGAPGDEVVEVRARVGVRRGDGPGPARVMLRVLGLSKDSPPQAAADLSWATGQSSQAVSLAVAVPAREASRGRLLLAASIDRDAVEGDNAYLRPLEVRERLDVAIVAPTSGEPPRSLAAFTPADWLALALAPDAAGPSRRRQGADLRVTIMDPARAVTAGALEGAAAVLLPRPDLLDESGWRAVRAACDSGALVLVFAPPIDTPHTWTDALTSSMGLTGWTFPREPTTHEPPQRLSPVRAVPPERDLLGLVAPELADLGAPVRFSRTLIPTRPPAGAASAAEAVLTLDDSSPLLLATSPGDAPHARGVLLYAGFAADLSWTDLPTKPLMVPLLQELLRQGAGRAAGDTTALAGNPPTLPPGAAELTPISEGANARRLDPQGRPTPPVRTRGAYVVRAASGAGLGAVAFNADPAASDLTPRDPAALARWLAGLGAEVEWLAPEAGVAAGAPAPRAGRDDDASPLSLPLLLAALALALVEAVLARVFSHADMAPRAASPAAAPEARAA